MEVVVDDDWRRTVARTPIMRPATGFARISLFVNASPAVFPAAKVKKIIATFFAKQFMNYATDN